MCVCSFSSLSPSLVIFGQLANANGAIVADGLRLFVRILKQVFTHTLRCVAL